MGHGVWLEGLPAPSNHTGLIKRPQVHGLSLKVSLGMNFLVFVPSLAGIHLLFNSWASWWFLVPVDEHSVPTCLRPGSASAVISPPPFGFIQPSCRSRAEGVDRALGEGQVGVSGGPWEGGAPIEGRGGEAVLPDSMGLVGALVRHCPGSLRGTGRFTCNGLGRGEAET